MGVLFPNTIANLLDGPVRCLYAPVSVPLPDTIDKIIGMVFPYTPATGWIDFGATSDAASYSRDMSSEEYTIEQETTSVFSRVTETTRQFTLPLSEITPANMKIIEEGGAVTQVAAATGKSAQKRAGFGSIQSLTRYRIAFIAQRDPGFGSVVSESGTVGAIKRGPFVALVGYQCSLAAAGSSLEIAKGTLAHREVTFTMFPQDGIPNSNENTGNFLFEDPGVIT
jgi:hypothetical protein